MTCRICRLNAKNAFGPVLCFECAHLSQHFLLSLANQSPPQKKLFYLEKLPNLSPIHLMQFHSVGTFSVKMWTLNLK